MLTNTVSELEGDVAAAATAIKRRHFLRGALVVSAGLTVLGTNGCSSDGGIDVQAKRYDVNYLDPSQLPLVEKLVEALLPHEQGELMPADPAQIIANVDGLMGHMAPALRADLNAMLKAFNWSAVLLSGKFSRFEKLPSEQALGYLDGWQSSGVIKRSIATVLKKFIYLSYWREPASWTAIDYDGPVSEKWGIPSLGNAPLPQQANS